MLSLRSSSQWSWRDFDPVTFTFFGCQGRQVVKRILSSCTVCKKMEGPSYGTPLAPPLPEFRLSNDFAFIRVGVDYAGPLYVKDIYTGDEMHIVVCCIIKLRQQPSYTLGSCPGRQLKNVYPKSQTVYRSTWNSIPSHLG